MDFNKSQPANKDRAIFEKKFKLNDGTRKFVEANTLLEPANNSSAMQHDIEEIREVSTQLSSIKKKHDETKRICIKKQEELDAIREEIKNLGIQETVAEGPAFATANRLETLAIQHQETQDRIDEENLTQATYKYMLERLEKDFIATKIRSTELDASIKSKRGILDLEGGKQRKTKEERLQAKAIFDNLMKNIELEQKDRQERIFELQKCIQNKEASVSRRIERQRKNAEIAEAAANENKDSSELKMRENLYTQKLWNTYMRKRMEKEMRNSAQIDEAFKNIKTATQVTDVQEMVRKFLTREQTYSSLLKTVSESENKIDLLKKSNEELRAQLHDLTLDSSNSQDKDKTASVADNDSDIIMMNNELSTVLKEHQRLGDRFKGINIVNDQISNWAKRIYKKFGNLTTDETFQKPPTDLVTVFNAMHTVVEHELNELAQKQAEEDAGIEYDQVFNDFANEDFVHKNIRVRPVSGLNDETRDGRQSNVSRGGMGDENQDGEDRFNQDALLELEQERKNVKTILKKKMDEAERKAALLEAAKKKKSD